MASNVQTRSLSDLTSARRGALIAYRWLLLAFLLAGAAPDLPGRARRLQHHQPRGQHRQRVQRASQPRLHDGRRRGHHPHPRAHRPAGCAAARPGRPCSSCRPACCRACWPDWPTTPPCTAACTPWTACSPWASPASCTQQHAGGDHEPGRRAGECGRSRAGAATWAARRPGPVVCGSAPGCGPARCWRPSPRWP